MCLASLQLNPPIVHPPPLLPAGLQVTGGLTQYLFYSRNVTSATATTSSKLSIQGRNANAYMVFVNGVLQTSGNQHGHSSGDHTFGLTLSLESGPNELLILSESFGFGNGMASGVCAA